MEQVETHLRGNKKYVLMKLDDFNDFLRRFRIQNYEHITKRIHNKSGNRAALLKICNGVIKDFRKQHPEILRGEYQQSLAKRLAGCLYSWLYNDVRLKDLKGVKDEEK